MLASHLEKEGKNIWIGQEDPQTAVQLWESQPANQRVPVQKTAHRGEAKWPHIVGPWILIMLSHWLEVAQKVCGLDLKTKTDLEVLGLQVPTLLATDSISKGNMSGSLLCNSELVILFNLFPLKYLADTK